jgi:hypothetical protein
MLLILLLHTGAAAPWQKFRITGNVVNQVKHALGGMPHQRGFINLMSHWVKRSCLIKE